MIDKCTALTTTQNEPEKIDPEEQASNDLPEQELPEQELPDLTRLYKLRCRDGDIMQKCKHLLIAGMLPGRAALICRLPLEKVQELFNSSYNPRCRRFTNPNNGRLVMTTWKERASLSEICQTLGLPLFTVVAYLRQNGITDAAMAPRMPPYDDPLCVEYRQVVARKAASKFKPIQINPVRRSRRADAGTTAMV